MKQFVTICSIFFVTALTLSKADTAIPCSTVLINMETIGTFAASAGAVIRNYSAGSCPLVQAYSRILSTAVLGQPFTPACDDIDGNLASIQTAVTGLTANYVDFKQNGFSDDLCEQINKNLAVLVASGVLPK